MKVVFVCQTVDRHDSIQAATVRWLEALACKPQVESVGVIALGKDQSGLVRRCAN